MMEDQPINKDYFDVLHRRTWITWLLSGLVAIGLNSIFFLVLPHLVEPTPSRLQADTVIPHVNVIRMKKPETEVRKKRVKPPPPPEEKPKQRPKATPPRPVRQKLTLPFQVNPRLPTGPGSLELPPLASAPLASTDTLGGTFDVGQLDGPLTTITRIPPMYPLYARRRGIEGWVKVGFIVDENGNVGNITVLEADPPGLFEESVENCVHGWRFKPGTVEGMPVRAKVETTIKFELE